MSSENNIKKNKFGFVLFTTLLALALIVSGCSPNKLNDFDNDKLVVVTSIYPYYDFVKNVAGDNANVFMLVPPGGDAHNYDPKPSDIIKIQNSNLVVYTSEDMEPWMYRLVRNLPKSNYRDILVTEDIEGVFLLSLDDDHHDDEYDDDDEHDDDREENEEEHDDEHNHSDFDPHLWLNFDNNIVIVMQIAESLSLLDPVNRNYYLSNAEAYVEELLLLKKDYEVLRNCESNILITSHDAFGYVAYEYGLTFVPILGLSHDSEPSTSKIRQIIDVSKEHNVKHFFLEFGASPSLINGLVRETGSSVLLLDPAENLPRDMFEKETFISVMRLNLDSLVQGLECK